ncbi:MAG: ROK family protein [Spirochaetes bacterium]|nr:ROK family protein [Spirochaetota bacterium]
MAEKEGFYQRVVRNNNRKKIFRLIRKRRMITKLEISQILGLSITTVSSNIKELIRKGFIKESGYGESTGGRKAQLLEYLPDSRYSIGLELKENHGRVILADLDCNIIKEKVYTDLDLSNLVKCTIRILNSFIEEVNAGDKLLGIGISLPGTVDVEKSILESAPNMGIKRADLSKLRLAFGVPVFMDNEANCSAYGEYEFMELEDQPLFFISVTEGIGGAIIVDKKLYNGKNHRAGEIGHITINFEGENCSCGNKGCWERYASVRALERMISRKGLTEFSGLDEIFSAYSKNDAMKKIIDEYAANISYGIRNLLMIFDPSIIIIGGEICRYENQLLPEIKRNVFQNNDFYVETDVDIVFSVLKENSGIIGAVLFVIDNI